MMPVKRPSHHKRGIYSSGLTGTAYAYVPNKARSERENVKKVVSMASVIRDLIREHERLHPCKTSSKLAHLLPGLDCIAAIDPKVGKKHGGRKPRNAPSATVDDSAKSISTDAWEGELRDQSTALENVGVDDACSGTATTDVETSPSATEESSQTSQATDEDWAFLQLESLHNATAFDDHLASLVQQYPFQCLEILDCAAHIDDTGMLAVL